MNDLNRYRYEDLSGVAKTILVISTIGALWSMFNSFTHMASIGIAYGVIELIGAIGTVAACFLMLSVNIWGFYLYLGMFATAFIGVICIDVEAGLEYLFSAIGAIGFVFLVLLTKKKNGISAWKMMLANNRNKGDNYSQEHTTSSNSNTNGIEDDSKSSVSPISPISDELPSISTVNEISIDSPVSIIPPPVSQVADDLNSGRAITTSQQAEHKGANVSNQPKEESNFKRLLRVRLNIFLYIALGLFISAQILSIYMDGSFISLGKYYWDPIVETWRIVLSSINIALALVIILWKKGWAYICLTIVSIASIFMIDSMSLKLGWDKRDMTFNFILFAGAYLPLIITLFFKNQGVSGWRLLFGQTLALIPQTTTLPRSNHVTENSPIIANEEIDRYTRLYRAISPANFVEPYSPEKVKLANELLEALIKNKDNEVVISLIEEKAKCELGVRLSD